MLAGCSQSQDKMEVDGSVTLQDVLDDANKAAEAIPGLHSLIIWKDGKILKETYYHGYDGQSAEHVRSVTKSVVSILTGIAIQQGHLTLNQPIGAYFPALDGAKRNITVSDLLTMSSGFEWDEDSAKGYNEWRTSADQVAFVLNKDLSDTPGEVFSYNSGAYHLMGIILAAATKMPLDTYAEEQLFQPLDIKRGSWEKIAGGVNGGAGLTLKPTDMLKIGQLMLNKGTYDGKQIVPEAWVERITNPYHTLYEGEKEQEGYGYGWWTLQYDSKLLYAAKGYAGQNIAVMPTTNTIIITTARWTGLGGKVYEQSRAINQLIGKKIGLPIYTNGL